MFQRFKRNFAWATWLAPKNYTAITFIGHFYIEYHSNFSGRATWPKPNKTLNIVHGSIWRKIISGAMIWRHRWRHFVRHKLSLRLMQGVWLTLIRWGYLSVKSKLRKFNKNSSKKSVIAENRWTWPFPTYINCLTTKGIKAAVSQIFTELWLKILFHKQF